MCALCRLDSMFQLQRGFTINIVIYQQIKIEIEYQQFTYFIHNDIRKLTTKAKVMYVPNIKK